MMNTRVDGTSPIRPIIGGKTTNGRTGIQYSRSEKVGNTLHFGKPLNQMLPEISYLWRSCIDRQPRLEIHRQYSTSLTRPG